MKHTQGELKLKWTRRGYQIIPPDGHGFIATVRNRPTKTNNIEEQEANARRFVKCWNNHEAMIEVLKQVITHHGTHQLYDKLNIRNIESMLEKLEE